MVPWAPVHEALRAPVFPWFCYSFFERKLLHFIYIAVLIVDDAANYTEVVDSFDDMGLKERK